MLLAIDIGNTNITLGVFKTGSKGSVKKPVKTWRLSTNESKTSDEYGTKIIDLFNYSSIKTSEIDAIAVASVVPRLDMVFEEVSKKYFKNEAFFINSEVNMPLKILYKNPAEVGADRIANAVAAFELYGGPIVVIDFGTATTFDCISKNEEYLGGVIVPGPLVAAESLVQRTAKLPEVEIVKPKSAIGKSTKSGIQSGIYYGYIGLINEVLKRVLKEIPGKTKVIATGGLAELFSKAIKGIGRVVPELTLEGIRLIWEKNQKA